MRVALLGTFDIANYGDLLFPEIAQTRLKGVADVVCYSPVGGPAIWPDTPATTDVDLLPDHDVDAVILGGGNLVHARPWNHATYDTGGLRGYVAYPRLWYGASVAAAARRIPLCWNAPGAPERFGPSDGALVREAASVADYLSVRDRFSACQLADAGVTAKVAIVPDPGLDVSRLWSDGEIAAAYEEIWAAADRRAPRLTVSVHLNSRYVEESPAVLAARLDAIAHRLGATVVMTPLGPCHGDDVLARRVGEAMQTEPLVLTPRAGIRATAAAIGRSDAHLGSSLHGLITALAFGVPARLVGAGSRMTKFTGFLEQFPMEALTLDTWADAEAAVEPLVSSGSDFSVRDAAAPILDRHWDRIGDAITEPRRTGAQRGPQPDLRPRRLDELVPSVLAGLSSTIDHLRKQLETADPPVENAQDQVDRVEVRERPVFEPVTVASQPTDGASLSVAVVSWDLGHNAFGRAHLLADMLSTRNDVVLVGAHFPEFGTEVWEPLRDTAIPLRRYPGKQFPQHFDTMERMAADLTADVVYAVKPRLPGLGVGFLAKEGAGRPLVVDCDDLELSFVGADHGITLGELEGLRGHPDFLRPQGRIWTSFSEWAVRLADGVTVSNAALAARYGGSVIPHARDERVFDPALYDRDEARARLGLASDDRVVLFAGTPRRHKGIHQVAAALAKIGDRRNRLCLLATPELDAVKPLLDGLLDWLLPIPPQPFSQLPKLLSAADVVCVLQDPANEMARWQMPAKITDALAMGVPCLVTPTAPLLPLIDEGGLVAVDEDSLAQHLERLLADPHGRAEQGRKGREIFLRRFSYAAVRPQLEKVLRAAVTKGGPPAADLTATVSFQRSLFAASSAPGVERTEPSEDAPATKEASVAAPRPRPVPRSFGGDRFDVVMFWRQNDSGIYGRRQDMLVKYLAASPKVRRIVHFDEAIPAPALLARWKEGRQDRFSQSSLVARQTLRRVKGTHPLPKVSAHTFVYQGDRREDGAGLRRFLPPRSQYEAYVADVLARNGIGEVPVVFWAFPRHFEFPAFVRTFKPDLVVSDVIDDTRSWASEGQKERLTKNYAEVLGMSDLVIANCEAVKVAMAEFASSDIHVVPNACEFPTTGNPTRKRPKELRRARGPIVGYVGNLSSRIDIDLLEKMVLRRPDWQLVLIGSAHLSRDVLDLARFDNVHLLGVRPYDQLQAYLQSFDVAIVPHLDDAMTRVMNPLKVFVYCAANVPVVSTAVGNMEEMRALVRVASDHDDFIGAVDEAIRRGRSAAPSAEQATLLEANSWPRRVDEVLALVEARLQTVGAQSCS